MSGERFESISIDDAWNFEIPTGLNLRAELNLRGLKHAMMGGYLHERTDGGIPSILFGCE